MLLFTERPSWGGEDGQAGPNWSENEVEDATLDADGFESHSYGDGAGHSGHEVDFGEEIDELLIAGIEAKGLTIAALEMVWTKWNRAHLQTGDESAVVLMLVHPVPGRTGTWTVVDPNRRVQLQDLRSGRIFAKAKAKWQLAPFEGLTAAQKEKAEDDSVKLIRRVAGDSWFSIPAGLTGKAGKDKLKGKGLGKSGKGKSSAKSNFVWWLAQSVVTLGGAVWSYKFIGTFGLGCLVSYKAWKFFGIGELIDDSMNVLRSASETADRVTDTQDNFMERWEEGGFDGVVLAVLAVGFLGMLVVYYCGGCEMKKKRFTGDGFVTDSDSDGSVDLGTAASDTDDDDGLMRHPGMRLLLEQQAELQSQLAKLSAAKRDSSDDEKAATFMTAQEDESVKRGIDGLMARLMAHEKQVAEDQGGRGGVVPGRPLGGRDRFSSGAVKSFAAQGQMGKPVDHYIQELEQEARDPRAAMFSQMKQYETADWSIGPSQARIAPMVLARMYKFGTSAKFQVQQYVRAKELEACHAASEMALMAAILDRMLNSDQDMVNSQAVEVICRRLYGLFRAFENAKKQSDWKQPRGEGGKRWKSKVRWELADEYDAVALESDDWAITDADEEVRKRLERKALFNKYLDKAFPEGAREAAE